MEISVSNNETYERVYVDESAVDLHITQEAGSRVKIHVINLATLGEHHIRVDIQGEGCTTEIYGLSREGTIHTNVRHEVGGSESRQLVKFVLDEHERDGERVGAVGSFFGELYIAKDAQKTDAQQTNRNLLLSRRARMNTKPQLEIYADDVKASHGASTGQLDTSALFYMQQRCIDPEAGRKLLIGAFMREVLMTISDEALREEIEEKIG